MGRRLLVNFYSLFSTNYKQSIRARMAPFYLFILWGFHQSTVFADGDCLYSSSNELGAVMRGNEKRPVVPCNKDDPLSLSKDDRILGLINHIGLSQVEIKFVGCSDSAFFVRQVESKPGISIYEIHYNFKNIEKTDVYAPIAHELAHVLQMESYGGLEQLRQKYSSLQLELSADYLVGLVYSSVFSDHNKSAFQTNLSLVGEYDKKVNDQHGTPSQRTAAFRAGFYSKNTRFIASFGKEIDLFLSKDYAWISGM